MISPKHKRMKRMKDKKVDNLLKAINLADYDNLKSVEISLDDLKLLRGHIITLEDLISSEQKRHVIAISKLQLELLEKPIKLDIYC
jgi:hypothetical protein